MDWVPAYGRELITAARTRRPADTMPALKNPPDPDEEGDVLLFRVDLDRDGRDDLARVSYERRKGPVQLRFWTAPQ